MTDTRKKVTNALRKYKQSLAKVDKKEAKKLNAISYEVLAKEHKVVAFKLGDVIVPSINTLALTRTQASALAKILTGWCQPTQ